MILSNSDLDCLCLNESWLNGSIPDDQLHIPNYTLHRYDRDGGSCKRGGGGNLIYTKDNHSWYMMTKWCLCTPDIECLWVKLDLPSTRPTYVCSVYRPPEGSADKSLSLIEQTIIDIYASGLDDVIIMGDFNIDLLPKRESKYKKYVQFLKTNKLTQLVMSPTRVTLRSQSLIDHIVINQEDLYIQHGVVDPGLSHCMAFTARKKAKSPKVISHVKCRNYRNFVDIAFQNDISHIDWSDLYAQRDASISASPFQEKFLSVLDRHAIFRQREHAPPWLNTKYFVSSGCQGALGKYIQEESN